MRYALVDDLDLFNTMLGCAHEQKAHGGAVNYRASLFKRMEGASSIDERVWLIGVVNKLKYILGHLWALSHDSKHNEVTFSKIFKNSL